jgi:hypothetical protein
MTCSSLPRRVAILALGFACAWLGSSPVHAQDLQPRPRRTLVELSLGMGAYFFKVEQIAFDDLFGVDCKVAHAQFEEYAEDAGDYHNSGWMVAPSGLVSFLL